MSLSYLPNPDFLEFTFPMTSVVLVTNEGSSLTSKVIKRLEKHGHNAVALNLPGINPENVEKSVNLSAVSDDAITAALAEVNNKYGSICSFIHLHPHFEFENGNFTQHFIQDREHVKTVFLLAKHLKAPLNELGKKQRANFMTVSRLDGKLGLGKRGNVSVVGGGLPGLVKSLNLEWSPVFCRAVDVQPELTPGKLAKQIIAEFHDADLSVIETCYSEEGRATISTKKVEVKEHSEISTKVTEDSVFLVSGGGKGVTATCVIEMAKAFKCKFILMGRSNFEFEVPEFAKSISDDGELKRLIMMDLKEKGQKPDLKLVKSTFSNIIAKKEIEATLKAIEGHGGKAVYMQADVTAGPATALKVKKVEKTFGKITGVLHGAGRLADKLIENKTATDFDNVLSVKLDGLLTLLQSVDIHNLQHLVLFSSVAGFYGNLGQTDYAIANEILSKSAHLFKTNHPNTHVSAINWGAWDGGMVSAELKKKFEEAGVSLVNSEGGAAMMVNELNHDYFNEPQMIIGGTLPAAISHIHEDLKTYRVHRNLKAEENPFLMHHVIQGNAVLPVVNAVGWMGLSCERLYPDFGVFEIQDAKLFKGLVFDGDQPEQFIAELKEVEKTAEKIVFDASILSEGPKLPVFHYKARVILMHKNATPKSPSFKHTLSGTYTPESGERLYKDGSLFHDTFFRGIEKIIDWTDKQIILSCKAPDVPVSAQGQFPVKSVNTFFSDIQYQGMVIWVQHFFKGAKSLPLATDSARIYKAVPFGKELFVHIDVVESNAYKMAANCTVYDEDGTVYMETRNAAVTVSKSLEW